MLLEVPEDIAKCAGLTPRDCLIELATRLYAARRISIGHALRLCGLDRSGFGEALAARNITTYTVEDLDSDVETLKRLGRL
jgi:predicted HTH domain antitoxin